MIHNTRSQDVCAFLEPSTLDSSVAPESVSLAVLILASASEKKPFSSQTLNFQRLFPWLTECVPWSLAGCLTSLRSYVYQPNPSYSECGQMIPNNVQASARSPCDAVFVIPALR